MLPNFSRMQRMGHMREGASSQWGCRGGWGFLYPIRIPVLRIYIYIYIYIYINYSKCMYCGHPHASPCPRHTALGHPRAVPPQKSSWSRPVILAKTTAIQSTDDGRPVLATNRARPDLVGPEQPPYPHVVLPPNPMRGAIQI
jgi:hypothetical protein